MIGDREFRIRITAQDTVERQALRDVAALNKLDAAAARTSARMRAVDRIANKALPGGGLGNAIGGALGGGLGATLAVGGAFAAVGGLRSLITEAMELDRTAAASAEQVKEMTRWSDSAIESLSYVGQAFQGTFAGLKKIAAETLGGIMSLLTGVAGIVAKVLGGFGFFDNRMNRAADSLITRSILSRPEWMGGLGGSGEQAVKEAEERLKKRREERDKQRGRGGRSAAGGSDPMAPGLFVAGDELAKIGLFRGGSGGESMTDLQKKTNENLKSLERGIRDLAPRIAREL